MTGRNENTAPTAAKYYRRYLPILVAFVALTAAFFSSCSISGRDLKPITNVSTLAGIDGQIGEPFGIASKDGVTYISDGENGKIWRAAADGTLTAFASGLDTPSAIAFDKNGDLFVADSGSNTIKKINNAGTVITIAGVEGKSGFADGEAGAVLFNAPVGIAVGEDGRIFVADTYNDKIRVIENGKVTTLAGSSSGFADGIGTYSKFDMPAGLAIWQGKLLVADSGNYRIRVVEPDGVVWTLAGNGESDIKNGSPLSSALFQPMAIAVDAAGSIYFADGNAIRRLGGILPVVVTVADQPRGLRDGHFSVARFNRPSGLAFDSNGDLLIADSENRLVRKVSADKSGHELTRDEITARRDKPEEFRNAQPARWPYDPPTAKRDIAGTLGEVRGEVVEGSDDVWFHNGLDVAGAYGETARFVRTEKVLKINAAENFGTLRELIRMPTMGYIHIRLGRDSNGTSFSDPRFQFQTDSLGKVVNVRVPRGSKFAAGDRIGTLNPMNHVHLIAGRSGSEMNALDALTLPGISDSRQPVIEKVTLTDKNWNEVETTFGNSRIRLRDPVRIVVRAYDQVDGNSERRRLGVYSVNYQLMRDDSPVLSGEGIRFDRMPPNEGVKFVYGPKSHSGATGETIFNYIATNSVEGDSYKEGFLDASTLDAGHFTIRVTAADYFGNTTTKDIFIEVIK